MFAAFEAVFADQPHRLYKVMPGWPGHDLAERQFEAATDRAYNPGNVKFDGYAIAAYVGGGRDGASPEIFTQLRADLESAKPGTDGWQHMRNLCDSNGVELIAYECGVDVTTNAASYTLDPRMYDWFTHYYNEASEYFDLMVHFAYCGTYEMHVKLWSEQPTAEAYTYQAIRDWLIANPVGVSPKATPATSRVSPTMAPFGILNRLTSAGSLVPATGAAQLFSLQGRRASGWRPGLGGAVPRLPRVYLVVADDE